jgi:hypothetical protein
VVAARAWAVLPAEASRVAGAAGVLVADAAGRDWLALSIAAIRSLLRTFAEGRPSEVANAWSSGSSMLEREPDRRFARAAAALPELLGEVVFAESASELDRTSSWSWVFVTMVSDPSEVVAAESESSGLACAE